MDLGILYEDNHIIAVNKPPGMLSQGDETGDESVFDHVKEYIRTTYNKQGNIYCALLHRIDRPVGGVLLLGKTGKAAERMSRLFQERKIHKVYYAITTAIPSPREGHLRHYLTRVADKNVMKASLSPSEHSQVADLDYTVLRTLGEKALVEVRPVTGRRHQIRVQLAAIGCSIQGDVKYGRSGPNTSGRDICLHSRSITFPHPVKEKGEITITAPLPDTLEWAAWK